MDSRINYLSFVGATDSDGSGSVTNIQLMEWLAKGYGIAKRVDGGTCLDTVGPCPEDMLDATIKDSIRIRKFGDSEWHVPTPEYMWGGRK